jgi:hypothetical protein
MRATTSFIRPQLLRPATLRCQNLDRDLRLAADGDRLLERRHLLVGLVAHVGGVDAAVARGDAGERDELVGLGVRARRVDEGRREAEGALLHRLFDERFHLPQLFRRRLHVVVAEHHAAHLRAPTKEARLIAGLAACRRAK